MELAFKILLAIIALLTIGTRAATAEETVMNWTIDGVTREALVIVPPAAPSPSPKRPVLFAFHGHGGGMRLMALTVGFQRLWPEAIVVYPQGLPTATPRDPQGLKPGWQFASGDNADRDLKFFDAILASLKKDPSVDEHRVYAAGFSNGGVFSYVLWDERARDLRAFGIGAGAARKVPTLARPAVILAGQSDKILPFAKQQESIEAILQLDRVTKPGQACGQDCTLYASTTGTPVMTLIHSGGHFFPPWAAQAMVEFFKSNAAIK